MISPLAERKELAPVPWRSSTLSLCWVFSTCASSSPLEADFLCVACFTRFACPTCRAFALPLEERRDIFRVLQKLPPETKGEEAEQRPKEAAEGAASAAEVSARRDGGPAGGQVRVVVSLPFARHARMVLLRLWNLPRPILRVLRALHVIFVLIVALLWRIAPCLPCEGGARGGGGLAPTRRTRGGGGRLALTRRTGGGGLALTRRTGGGGVGANEACAEPDWRHV